MVVSRYVLNNSPLIGLDQELLSKALKVVENYWILACLGLFNCVFWCVLILFVVIHVCPYLI
ncbi:conserved hypothetical protein [Vibrio crassostreae]|nr:conserved hypothetical protein [Vibrio crassostreae]CAK3479194.1 conserved hypothetical protein [Vibrio crassostreae]CAK3484733.1 conserved hypothetical protein [Vibrio crassostreae]CAK3511908.1 conserved hypothetical protein [Vibrio crassostreae]CAK3550218.1 conserved hypothetical protein [Vibrio crassostreae]